MSRSLHAEMSVSAGGILKGISVRRSLWSEMYVKAGGISKSIRASRSQCRDVRLRSPLSMEVIIQGCPLVQVVHSQEYP